MKKLLVFLSFFFVCFTLQAQEVKLPTFISDSLENYIHKGMNKWEIPGLSVAIVKDGKVVFIKGYGSKEIGGDKVDENTLFMIGSNTKAFTATAITLLQEEGKLSLQDKVQKWMPEFALKNTAAGQMATIADLLCHRLGFETFQGDFTYWKSNLTREEIIHKMGSIDAPYPFRTHWGYCNAAFLTAGQIIPRITGKSWEETVREKILQPLNMSRTLVLAKDLPNAQNVARPHSLVNGKISQIEVTQLDNLAPAGSMSSSAKDMSKWLLAQLNEGKIEGKQVINKNALLAIRQPYSIMGINPRDKQETHFYLYGLGLSINDRDGKLVYSHTGGVDGFLSSVMFIPEDNLGIVVLTNTDQNSFFLALTNEIRDAFLELPYQNFSQLALIDFKREKMDEISLIDSLKQLVNTNSKPALGLEAFTGTYFNEVYGDIKIVLEENELTIHFSNHPTITAKLEFIKDNSFLCTYSDPTFGVVQMPFKTDNGKVTGLTLTVNDFVEFTPYEFVKKE